MHGAQIRVEIEHAPHPAHDARNRARIGVADLQQQFRSFRGGAHPDPARCIGGADHALIAVVVHAFDAGDRAFGEEAQQHREIQRRPIAQTQGQCAAGRDCRRFQPADRTRRHAAAALERGVEATQAVVARRQRDIGHRQCGFGQQLFREQQPAGRMHRVRRRADMCEEHPLQLPCAQPDPRRQCIGAAVLQRTVGDQGQRAAHRVFAHLRMRFGRELGPTAQTGPVAGRSGCGGVRVEGDVFPLRRRRRAHRPAIDAGAAHGDEEQAVEAMVLRGHRPEADLARRQGIDGGEGVGHDAIIGRRDGGDSPFSDTDVLCGQRSRAEAQAA